MGIRKRSSILHYAKAPFRRLGSVHRGTNRTLELHLWQLHCETLPAAPIKETMDHLREALFWLGEPVVKQKKTQQHAHLPRPADWLRGRRDPPESGNQLQGTFQCIPNGTGTILCRKRLVQWPVRSAHL